MFVFIKIRFDITYIFSLLNRFKNNFDFIHVVVFQRMFRYIKKII